MPAVVYTVFIYFQTHCLRCGLTLAVGGYCFETGEVLADDGLSIDVSFRATACAGPIGGAATIASKVTRQAGVAAHRMVQNFDIAQRKWR